MKKRIFSDEEKELIIKLYKSEGWKMGEIAKKFSCKPTKISELLHERGIEIKKVRTKNRLLKEDYFENIDSPEKSYFLGLMFTDGYVARDKKEERAPQIGIQLKESDKEILELLKNEINSNSSLRYEKRKNRNNSGTFCLSFRSKKMAEDLSKYNIVPNKTYLVTQLIIPDQYDIDFLRGIIDGDGSIYYSAGIWHVSITGHSEEILKQLRDYCDGLIGKPTHNTITTGRDVHKITWNGMWASKLLKLLYYDGCCAIARKARLATKALEDK